MNTLRNTLIVSLLSLTSINTFAVEPVETLVNLSNTQVQIKEALNISIKESLASLNIEPIKTDSLVKLSLDLDQVNLATSKSILNADVIAE
jgi:hypothetical protein